MQIRQNQVETGDTRFGLFLSHRHEDAGIAAAVGSLLRDATAGNVDVCVSSDSRFSGPRPADGLHDGIRQAVARSQALLLLYTGGPADWSWCLLETFLAMEVVHIPVLILSTDRKRPSALQHIHSVHSRSRNELRAFVRHFLTASDFFKDQREPLTRHTPDGEAVRDLADRLHRSLAAGRSSAAFDSISHEVRWLVLAFASTTLIAVLLAVTGVSEPEVFAALLAVALAVCSWFVTRTVANGPRIVLGTPAAGNAIED